MRLTFSVCFVVQCMWVRLKTELKGIHFFRIFTYLEEEKIKYRNRNRIETELYPHFSFWQSHQNVLFYSPTMIFDNIFRIWLTRCKSNTRCSCVWLIPNIFIWHRYFFHQQLFNNPRISFNNNCLQQKCTTT